MASKLIFDGVVYPSTKESVGIPDFVVSLNILSLQLQVDYYPTTGNPITTISIVDWNETTYTPDFFLHIIQKLEELFGLGDLVIFMDH